MNDDTKAKYRKWLKTYEPVLRFSAGENYFPLDVDWYIENCEGMVHKKNKRDVSIWAQDSNRSPLEKIEQLAKYGSDAYLQFVPRGHITIQNLVLFSLMLIHVLVIGWGMYPDNFAWIGPALFTPSEYVKVAVLGGLLVLWPFLRVNRKMYFAIVLNLFAALFFGTLQGLGFGILVLAFLIGMLVILVATWASLSLEERTRTRLGNKMISIVHILNTAANVLSIPGSLLLAGFVSWALIRLLAGRGLVLTSTVPLPTRFGTINIHPLDAGMAFTIGSAVLLVFWFWFAEACGDRIRTRYQKLSPQKFQLPPAEFKMLFVMTSSSVLLSLTYLLGWWFGLLTEGFGRSGLWLILILEAAIAGFWLFMHPLTPKKPSPELDENDRRDYILGWNGYALLVIFMGAIVWWGGSLLHFLRIYQAPFLFFILNVVVTILVSGSELGKFFIDLQSRQLDSDADRARVRYRRIIRDLGTEKKRFVYYGRVCEKGNWVVLQYHYFYAFNDWRRTAGGLNHHEGDWEAVSVYLHRASVHNTIDKMMPFGVAYSQHHDGVFCFWDQLDPSQQEPDPSEQIVRKTPSATGKHKPLVYVALGSHANYPWPDLYPSSTFFSGFLQKVIAWVNELLARFRPAVRMKESPDLEILRRRVHDLGTLFRGKPWKEREKKISPKPRFTKSPAAGLPIEYAAGDGLRVGAPPSPGNASITSEFKLAARLPEHIMHRESRFDGGSIVINEDGVKKPQDWDSLTWDCKLITDIDPIWVDYKGLWGRTSSYQDEAGPPGPKWERIGKDDKQDQRKRWGPKDAGLEWMDTLLFEMINDKEASLSARRRALVTLVEKRGISLAQ